MAHLVAATNTLKRKLDKLPSNARYRGYEYEKQRFVNKKLCIFASDLSALVGENAFVTKDEVVDKVILGAFRFDNKWKNSDFYRHLESNLKKNQEIRQVQELFEQIPTLSDLKNSVPRCKNTEDVDNFKKKVTQLYEKGEIKKSHVRLLNGHINMQFGSNREDNITDSPQFSGLEVIDQQKVVRYPFSAAGLIYGKLDGINKLDGNVIEIKTRTSAKGFGHVYASENIQLQAYMGMTDTRESMHVQQLLVNEHDHRIKKTTICFNEVTWNRILDACSHTERVVRGKLAVIFDSMWNPTGSTQTKRRAPQIP